MWPWKDRLASGTRRRARSSQGLSVTTDPTITAFGSTQHRVVLPAIGDRIDRYAILAELGAGAMGAVFLAADTQLDRRIAVKVLTRGTQDSRLLDEARALAKLQHPNVVAIHDVGRWSDRVYLAMEYIEGGSLATWLDSHDDWHERLDAFVQAARGLAAAHRAGLVHHDVKPSNIMVGNDGRVRLVDFGLARSTPELAEGTPAGTPTRAPISSRCASRSTRRSTTTIRSPATPPTSAPMPCSPIAWRSRARRASPRTSRPRSSKASPATRRNVIPRSMHSSMRSRRARGAGGSSLRSWLRLRSPPGSRPRSS
jgi:serine/threonine protein kinase